VQAEKKANPNFLLTNKRLENYLIFIALVQRATNLFSKCLSIVISQRLSRSCFTQARSEKKQDHASASARLESRAIRSQVTITRTPLRETLPVAFNPERQLRVLNRQKIRIDWHSAYVNCINSVPCTACTITYLQSHLDRRRLIPEPAGSRCVHTRQRFVARRSSRDTLARARAPLARRHAPGIMHAAVHENSRRHRRPYCLSRVHRLPPRDYRVSDNGRRGNEKRGKARCNLYGIAYRDAPW